MRTEFGLERTICDCKVCRTNCLYMPGFLIPTIRTDGSCINLTPEGLCSIHDISPFGCAMFDCGPERNQLSHSGLNAVYHAIFVNPVSLYRRIWTHLAERGLVQQAAEVLRAKMRKELE